MLLHYLYYTDPRKVQHKTSGKKQTEEQQSGLCIFCSIKMSLKYLAKEP